MHGRAQWLGKLHGKAERLGKLHGKAQMLAKIRTTCGHGKAHRQTLQKLHTSTHSRLFFLPGDLEEVWCWSSWASLAPGTKRNTMLEVKRKSPVVVALWRKLVEVVLDELDLLGHVVVLEIP